MKDNTKTTSKREYQFVIHGNASDAAEGRIEIVDTNKQVLRTFNVNKLPESIFGILVVHGLKQKMTDDTMVSKIGEDGDRLLACDELWTRLCAGEWEKEREGLARPPEAIVLFVMEKKNLDRETAVASLKQIGKDGWEGIRAKNATDINAIVLRLTKAKQAATGVDLTDL